MESLEIHCAAGRSHRRPPPRCHLDQRSGSLAQEHQGAPVEHLSSRRSRKTALDEKRRFPCEASVSSAGRLEVRRASRRIVRTAPPVPSSASRCSPRMQGPRSPQLYKVLTSPQPNLPDRLRQRRRLERRQLERRRRFRRRRITAALIVLVPIGLLVVLPSSGTHQGQIPASDSRALTRPRSNPSVLPGDLLIADRGNNRLLELDPAGHVVWQFPRPGDLRPGQTFKSPDDAFFDSSGQFVVATQEDDFVISVIDVRRHRIVYRYGRPEFPGRRRTGSTIPTTRSRWGAARSSAPTSRTAA